MKTKIGSQFIDYLSFDYANHIIFFVAYIKYAIFVVGFQDVVLINDNMKCKPRCRAINI